jgi:hypothetical protein
MQRQIRLLQQLVLDSMYTVDEMTVAEAIIARATARRLVADIGFRNDVGEPNDLHEPRELSDPQVQSFRPSRHARSFRPCSPAARR